jgi:hypothetical protein
MYYKPNESRQCGIDVGADIKIRGTEQKVLKHNNTYIVKCFFDKGTRQFN